MSAKFNRISLILIIAVLTAVSLGAVELEELTENQLIHGFNTVSLYENGSGVVIGARFVSEKYGFIADYLQIQSVPQAFFWVKTPPTSSKGEPHACEHLLLGKGNRGRLVAALEDMALASSTAYTAQTRTCYHFNTVGGDDTFYKVFEAKLQALLHPDFTDEEIRREVCHIGVNENPETGELSIDEKGTVFTEMVSSFEKPWYHTYSALNNMVYGDAHPLTFNSGGHPDVMRTMVPSDMWSFHKESHHLANMGTIVAMPAEVSIESFLTEINNILNRSQEASETFETASIRVTNLPPARPAPVGSVELVTYPSENENDPGYMLYAWPADVKLTTVEKELLDLFLDVFSGGSTSNLYNLFINSESRQIDLGGNYVYGAFDDDLDVSIYFGLVGVDSKNVTKANLGKVKEMILAEFDRIKNFPDGSDELKAFNQRALNRLAESKKQIENNLNSPPQFGFRGGPAGRWTSLLLEVERQDGFRKSLVSKNLLAEVESKLSEEKNIWRKYITDWKVLEAAPYMVGATPNPQMLVENAQAKQARIEAYTAEFKTKYKTDDVQIAYAKYSEEFDANTAALEKMKRNDKLPDFIDNPPMTLDDQLQYQTINLAGNVPMVASTFENMTSSQVAVALDMAVVPQTHLMYVPILPDILTELGVIKDGLPIPYDVVREKLRTDVLGLYAGYNIGREKERVELVITGRGSSPEELKRAVGWMEASLFAPNLRLENLSRLRDVVDQSLLGLRNRVKGSEESWVNDPANAFRFQNNPLMLASSSFLTQTHFMQRLKWMLTETEDETEIKRIDGFINALQVVGQQTDKEELNKTLTEIEAGDISTTSLSELYSGLKPSSQAVINELAKDLKATINDIPDENLKDDWVYLCQRSIADISSSPQQVIDDINFVLGLIRKVDNVRMYMVSNTSDRESSLNRIESFIGRLDNTGTAKKENYQDNEYITNRLKSRHHDLDHPVYTGLIFNGTRNGVLIFEAPNCGAYDTDEDVLMQSLSSKLYTGYGPHGLFMKTWAAGLAYSNGYRFNEKNGWARYYAERCPDVAQTMRFVVNELITAEENKGLVDYAVAQVFGASRAPSRYEARGKAMAEDITDGFTSDKVKEYRQKMLELRHDPDLYSKIRSRMSEAYGSVMIGYGKDLKEVEGGVYFLIGPEEQFVSLEDYIKSTEGEQTIYRLYPRDFWLVQ